MTLSNYQWKRFVERGETTDVFDELKADSYLCERILHVYYQEATNALTTLKKIPDESVPPHIKLTLIRRWEQIKDLIRSAFQNGINADTQAGISKLFDAPNPFIR